jgi:UDP-2,4-diacetamido-2,4,6-trideoxy-beta-L-altropyranose hydrolase
LEDAVTVARHVVFRADASSRIGHGHVVRCLTLAGVLRDHGIESTFVCREHDGHLCDRIAQRGFGVARLPLDAEAARTEHEEEGAGSLGACWHDDARETSAAIAALGPPPEWLIVDHYAIDRRWEAALRGQVGRIMVITDVPSSIHDCELLLDQNLVASMSERHADLVPPHCALLLGPTYALLQPEYASLRSATVPRGGAIKRILVAFGGADRNDMARRSVAAFLALHRSDIDVDVVVAGGADHASVVTLAREHANVHLHTPLPTLAPLMARADLAIGAGGTTTWERLALGLPALVVTTGDNQRAGAEELDRRGLIRWVGEAATVSDAELGAALREVVEQGLDPAWSERCRRTVDGMGAERVVVALAVSTDTVLRVRRAERRDEALVLEWANDAATRRNAFSSDAILPESHHVWFNARLDNVDGCHLYIVETETGVAIGQVRFERTGTDWEVHYGLDAPLRGRGLGRLMLELGLRAFETVERGAIVGRVKRDNLPSRRVFESLGFSVSPHTADGVVVYRRPAPDPPGLPAA